MYLCHFPFPSKEYMLKIDWFILVDFAFKGKDSLSAGVTSYFLKENVVDH